eukprot:PhM_4_TR3018/c4_g3_i8/m.89605
MERHRRRCVGPKHLSHLRQHQHELARDGQVAATATAAALGKHAHDGVVVLLGAQPKQRPDGAQQRRALRHGRRHARAGVGAQPVILRGVGRVVAALRDVREETLLEPGRVQHVERLDAVDTLQLHVLAAQHVAVGEQHGEVGFLRESVRHVVGDEDLAAQRLALHTRGHVHVVPVVVVALVDGVELRRHGVAVVHADAHAHAVPAVARALALALDEAHLLWPRRLLQRLLDRRRQQRGVQRRAARDHKGVADGLHLVAVVVRDLLPNDLVVHVQRDLHRVAVLLPQLRAGLDVREHESQRRLARGVAVHTPRAHCHDSEAAEHQGHDDHNGYGVENNVIRRRIDDEAAAHTAGVGLFAGRTGLARGRAHSRREGVRGAGRARQRDVAGLAVRVPRAGGAVRLQPERRGVVHDVGVVEVRRQEQPALRDVHARAGRRRGVHAAVAQLDGAAEDVVLVDVAERQHGGLRRGVGERRRGHGLHVAADHAVELGGGVLLHHAHGHDLRDPRHDDARPIHHGGRQDAVADEALQVGVHGHGEVLGGAAQRLAVGHEQVHVAGVCVACDDVARAVEEELGDAHLGVGPPPLVGRGDVHGQRGLDAAHAHQEAVDVDADAVLVGRDDADAVDGLVCCGDAGRVECAGEVVPYEDHVGLGPRQRLVRVAADDEGHVAVRLRRPVRDVRVVVVEEAFVGVRHDDVAAGPHVVDDVLRAVARLVREERGLVHALDLDVGVHGDELLLDGQAPEVEREHEAQVLDGAGVEGAHPQLGAGRAHEACVGLQCVGAGAYMENQNDCGDN